MAHLLRRAGFGATRDELCSYVEEGYESAVEELLFPVHPDNLPDDLIRRYHVDQAEMRNVNSAGGYWMYRMITTKTPLQEKMALFWHGLFATGYTKLNQATALLSQIQMFRDYGLGGFNSLLLELSKDPSMLMWLDNNDNHRGAINENFGRELLELFSMGIGNYSEEDIKECSRAFTGWTLSNVEYMAARAMKDSIWPYSRIGWKFDYRAEDHDDGEKTFLGETGFFNGEDIIAIISKNPATAKFICRRLFQFFASDDIDSAAEAVIEEMCAEYFNSNYEIRSVLRTLFNSEYFKSESARFSRVKGPVEFVVGIIRLAGSYRLPTLGVEELAKQVLYMGQGLLQPPTVEGWHEGQEWIDSGALVERVNFVANEISNLDNPGVRSIINGIISNHPYVISPADLVKTCLEYLGQFTVSQDTLAVLTKHVSMRGGLDLREHKPGNESEHRLSETLGLIVSSSEFQLS